MRALLKKPQGNLPPFMKSENWMRKQLNTALGSYTELKHDTILYTKQPYSMAQMALSGPGKGGYTLPPEAVHGYVEPVPVLYDRLREINQQLMAKLKELNFPSDLGLIWNFRSFNQILEQLATISRKELAGLPLDEKEYELIENIGMRVNKLMRFTHHRDITEKFISKMDKKMPVVADVFTDVNSEQVLEEAIGKPDLIFVIANVDGKPKVCLGGVYSYYEFKMPMNNRLTDEKWRDLIKQNKLPAQHPQWLNSIYGVSR